MKRAALIILDGWGYRTDPENNAVAQGGTPRLDDLAARYPFSTLGASGLSVGLPDGQMGNSEVGHLNLGAGRIVYQELTRINLAVESGEIFSNPALLQCAGKVKEAGGALHLIGLLSDGGVHSHQEHLYALIEFAKRERIKALYVHPLLDGRDTPPTSGAGYLSRLEGVLAEKGYGEIASVGGRFWGMDRDNRWERVERAFNAITKGDGERAASAVSCVEEAYKAGETDEFITPHVITGVEGTPIGAVGDGDGVIFFNFRADRAREITRAFTEEGFDAFSITDRPKLSSYLCMTEYDETFGLPVAFPPEKLENILGEVVSDAGATQLRIAETEKYAHVTFFFNGGMERVLPGEERLLIPSPRDVETYDEKPAMSAREVRDKLIFEVKKGTHDLIIVNFANLDMVGHTGIMEAAKEAVRVVDECVGSVVEALLESGYSTIITADHGNAEEMWDESGGEPMTAHSINRVPVIVAGGGLGGRTLRADGILADVAPTLLELMGLAVPDEMTGHSLLK